MRLDVTAGAGAAGGAASDDMPAEIARLNDTKMYTNNAARGGGRGAGGDSKKLHQKKKFASMQKKCAILCTRSWRPSQLYPRCRIYQGPPSQRCMPLLP